jgi:L-fuculose-phosphate aldolase
VDFASLAAPWIEIGRRLDARGILAGTEGNFSQRLADGKVLVTARGASTGRLTPADFALLDARGKRLEGGEPSSEYRLHLAVYAAHESAAAVVHAHPASATALAALGLALPADFLPELMLEFGSIPLIPYATPGTEEMGHAVEWHYRQGNAALLERHGAMTVGADPWQACARMEILERAAQVYVTARLLGGGPVGGLTADQRRALLRATGRLGAG